MLSALFFCALQQGKKFFKINLKTGIFVIMLLLWV